MYNNTLSNNIRRYILGTNEDTDLEIDLDEIEIAKFDYKYFEIKMYHM